MSLPLNAILLLCLCHIHGSDLQCNSTFKTAAFIEGTGPETTCDLDENITKVSLTELDRQLTSCMTVYFCSAESKVLLNRSLSIRNIHNVSFIGLNNFSLDCGGNKGLGFVNVTRLSMRNLNLINCARNYTVSVKYRGTKTFAFLSGLYILSCTDVYFENITISQSIGMGLSILSTRGRVIVLDCNFNSNGGHTVKGGTGLFIELSKHNHYKDIIGSSYNITNCTFTNNVAFESHIYFTPFGHGGGICVYIRDESSHNSINVSGCKFYNNTASSLGGAFFTSVHDKAANNSVTLTHCNFTRNESPLGQGGGAHVGYQCTESNGLCLKNSYIFNACVFEHNHAQHGGGTSFSSTRLQNSTISRELYNTVTYKKCIWVNNLANYGAAIILLPDRWTLFTTGTLPSPKFEDCTINENQVLEKDTTPIELQEPYRQSTMGVGALYCMLYSVHFKGKLEIKSNKGSAIFGSSCKLSFDKNTSAAFYQNKGHLGAALYLTGHSTITANENSLLNFTQNRAAVSGGAVYYQSSDILQHDYSQSCFISEVHHSNINFTFSGNTAGTGGEGMGQGNAIYITSLLPCLRQYKVTGLNATNAFLAKFTFVNESNQDVSTDVSKFSNTPNLTPETVVPVIPGKYTTLPFEGLDDLANPTDAVYMLTVSKDSNSSVKSQHSYITNNSITLLGNPGDEATIKLSTIGPRRTVLSFKIQLQHCPPGYILATDDNIDNPKICICSADINRPYIGIDVCDTLHFQAYRQRGFWFGYRENESVCDDSFISGYCPIGFCSYATISLPQIASAEVLSEAVCKPSRKGVLCSQCRENKSVYFHSPTFKCGDRDLCHLGWVFYIISDIVPVTLLFIVIVVFNIQLTSGSVNSFIFYSQVIGFFQITAHGRINMPKWTKPYIRLIEMLPKMFNLQFFNYDDLSFCILRKANTLDLMVFQYATFFYSLFLLLSILLLLRVCNLRKIKLFFRCRVHSIRTSMIHGLSAFLVLCFAQCANISLSLLSYGRIQGKKQKLVKTVVFLYAQYDWLSLNHLKYVLPAMVTTFVIVVIPLVTLLVYPHCYKCVQIMKIEETKCIRFLSKLVPIERLKPFLDSFQGCFKDNCRCFSGLYFLYRILIILYASLLYTDYFYITLEIQLIVMILLHAVVQPYRERKHNITDLLLLGNMAIVNGLTMYSFGRAHLPHGVRKQSHLMPIFQGLLILTPFISVVVYYSCKALKAMTLRCSRSRFQDKTVDDADLLDYCELPASRSQAEEEEEELVSSDSNQYNTFEY